MSIRSSLGPAVDAPLFRFREERPQIVAEVARRVHRAYMSEARDREDRALEYVLNEAAFMEIERLSRGVAPGDELRPRGWWVKLAVLVRAVPCPRSGVRSGVIRPDPPAEARSAAKRSMP